jgi:chemotaxis protein MotB
MGKKVLMLGVFLLLGFAVSGCATVDKANRADLLERENAQLRSQLAETNTEFDQAKSDLEKAFQKELGDYKAKLEMTERGLVITFLAEIFFDSGKDVVKSEGMEALKKVGKVLNEDVPGSKVAIEGHTDNDPIKYSGWKSNWELSSARSLAVLHYFVDECQLKPERLSAVAYGEFRPLESNDAALGKKKNRRVEIVILPSQVNKVKADKKI